MSPGAAARVFLVARGLLWSTAFVATWTWIALQIRAFDGTLGFAIPSPLRPVGAAIGAAGALLAGACIVTFLARGRGTPAPFDPPRRFVAAGPYRWVRNPMYLGAALVILGAGVFVGSPAIVLLAPAFLLLMHVVVVAYEEPSLAARFGEDYARYRAAVPRWFARRPRA